MMSSVALVHVLTLCSLYRQDICLPSLVLVVSGKTKGHEGAPGHACFASTTGIGYTPSQASYANFLIFKFSDFR